MVSVPELPHDTTAPGPLNQPSSKRRTAARKRSAGADAGPRVTRSRPRRLKPNMPYIISDTRRGLASSRSLPPPPAFIATPARAYAIANPYACTSSAFAAWSDYGSPTPVKNAGAEDGSTGWTLSGAAAVTRGNEPWKIGGASHANSLSLPAGSWLSPRRSASTRPTPTSGSSPRTPVPARLPEDRGPVLRHQGQPRQHEALRLHHHLDRLAADREPSRSASSRPRPRSLQPRSPSLHPSKSDRQLPDRRRLR